MKVDRSNFIKYGDRQLRFRVKLVNDGYGPDEQYLMSFWPVDNTIALFETVKPVLSNQFLRRGKVEKRGGGYITMEDLEIGNVLEIYSRKFAIIASDESTRAFLERERSPVRGVPNGPREAVSQPERQGGAATERLGSATSRRTTPLQPADAGGLPSVRGAVPILPLEGRVRGGGGTTLNTDGQTVVWGDVHEEGEGEKQRPMSHFAPMKSPPRSALKGSRRTARSAA